MVKIQGQVGLTSYPLAHISFIACQSTLPFLTYGYFEICDLGFRFKSIGLSILEIQLFQHLTLKYKVKVKGEVKVQGQVRGPTSYWFTSLLFHVNQPSHSWGMAISKFTHENIRSKSRSRVWSKFKFTVVPTSYQLSFLSFHVNQASHSWDATVSKFPVPNKHHGTLSFFSNISSWYDTTINQLYNTTPWNAVECWFAQAGADLLNFTPDNVYFDGVSPVIQTNGWHPNNISFKFKQIAAVCHCYYR